MQASLDYDTKEFGPYPYGHLTFPLIRGEPLLRGLDVLPLIEVKTDDNVEEAQIRG